MEQEIERYKRGETKQIATGDLTVERDFIPVSEAVRWYRLVMERGKRGEVYNVGSGASVPLGEILKRLLSEAGIPFTAVRHAEHTVPGKLVVPKIFADITKIKELA